MNLKINHSKEDETVVVMINNRRWIYVKNMDFLYRLAIWYNRHKNFETVEKIKENMNKYRVCGADAAIKNFSVYLNNNSIGE